MNYMIIKLVEKCELKNINIFVFLLLLFNSSFADDWGFDIESDLRPVGFGGSEAVQGLSISYMVLLNKFDVDVGLELYYEHTNYNNLPNDESYHFDDHQLGVNYVSRYKKHFSYMSIFNENINHVQPQYLHFGYGYTYFSSKHIDLLCRVFLKVPMMMFDVEYRTTHLYSIDFPIKFK